MTPFDTLPDLLLREEWRPLPSTVADATLTAAAAALGVGEAKRAAALLAAAPVMAGDAAAVAAVLRHVATTLEHNWFPGGGGAVLDAGALAAFVVPDVSVTGADAALVVMLGNRLVGAAPTWRSVAEGATRTGGNAWTIPVQEAATLLTDVRAAGMARAAGPAALVLADLLGRANAGSENAAIELARSAYAGDPVGLAACLLTELDRSLPGGRAETLGEDLEGIPVPLPAPAAGLAERYQELAERFNAAESDRGVAAVSLRQSRIARDLGHDDDAREHLDRALALASAAGDSALVHLAAVHAALLDIELGGLVDTAGVTAPIIDWATTVGSRSYVRGLARLCQRRAQRWRDADPVQGRRSLLLADALAEGVGAELESTLVSRELAAEYGAANFRRAALELSLARLASVTSSGAEPPVLDEVGWAALVDTAVLAHSDAVGLSDPEHLLVVRSELQWLTDHPPTTPQFPDAAAVFNSVLAETIAESTVLVPLYQGTAARDTGDSDTAATCFAAALAAAQQTGSKRLVASVLGTGRRFDEAVANVDDAVKAGQLPPYLQAPLYTRLKAFDRARAALPQQPPEDGRSWGGPALRAEIQLGLGAPASGVEDAAQSVERFERHLAALSRDVLRTSALDSLEVAGLYTTAVRIHAALASGTDEGRVHLERSFELSDRCRGMTLADLPKVDRDAATPGEAAAVRAWQQAGAELARTIEDVAASPTQPETIRSRIGSAERGLDDAEAAFAEAAPLLFRNRRRLPSSLPVPEVQQQLAPGTMLVQYHAFDDQVLAFTVTSNHADVQVSAAPTAQLKGDVRRFHRSVCDPATTAADRAELGEHLAATLLDPIADALATHNRLVVVPYGGLAVLPFHVLPWAGDELGTGHVVSYMPAVSAVLGASWTGAATGPALVLGDPAYAAGGLRRLPGTGVEAHAIAELRKVEPLVDAAAGLTTVLERLPSAAVVHLATHGFLREAAPYSSYLALAGTDRLTVPYLMGLGLHIDLAVLSACDSGRGRATAAGDVIGLTRALLGSGVRGLVVSLWPVDDMFACLTMVGFHERLIAGSPPAEALASASAELRTLDPDSARERYAQLASTHSVPAGERTIRSARDIGGELPLTPGSDPAHPSAWAPFVYVGPS